MSLESLQEERKLYCRLFVIKTAQIVEISAKIKQLDSELSKVENG